MWLENPIFHRDLEKIASAEYIPWNDLREKTVLVTGATGLIGHTLVSALLYTSRKRGLKLTVLALVRSEARARELFSAQMENSNDLHLLVGTVEVPPRIEGPVHYIVHGASQTASEAFVKKPVETIRTALLGTESMLAFAREKRSEGFVYLSSMEVYGHPPR